MITTLHMEHHKVQQGILEEKLAYEEVKSPEMVIGKKRKVVYYVGTRVRITMYDQFGLVWLVY